MDEEQKFLVNIIQKEISKRLWVTQSTKSGNFYKYWKYYSKKILEKNKIRDDLLKIEFKKLTLNFILLIASKTFRA